MLIGLHGKARAGKDQSYQYIAEWAQTEAHAVRRDAFADRLKVSAARALGFRGSYDEAIGFANDIKENRHVGFMTLVYDGAYTSELDPEAPNALITGREYLQYYGTEAHREVFSNDFWISAVLDHYDPNELLVVTDARFPNEAEAIQAAGGEIWRIVRPGYELITEDGHISEVPLSDSLIDRTIVNDSDLLHLRVLLNTELESLYYG